MSIKVRVEGFKELDQALSELGTLYRRKKAARDALMEAAEPLGDAAERNAPQRTGGKEKRFKVGASVLTRRRGALKRHVNVGTRLSRRQAMQNRADKMPVEVYIGTRDRAGRLVEFGTRFAAANPWLRRAWDAYGGTRALETIKAALWRQIERQAALQARAIKRGKK